MTAFLRKSTVEVGNSGHWIEAAGQSEESPHKGFPLLENEHGTFMFLPIDHCLLDSLSELSELGVAHLRIDNRFMSEGLFTRVMEHFNNPSEESFEMIKDASQARLIRGFYNTNKSDVLFKKLKNYRIQRKDKGTQVFLLVSFLQVEPDHVEGALEEFRLFVPDEIGEQISHVLEDLHHTVYTMRTC